MLLMKEESHARIKLISEVQYVSVGGKCFGVSLCLFWIPEGQLEIIPTKKGIFLTKFQWSALKKKLEELLLTHPELAVVSECINSRDNQQGMLECHECMPFG